MNSFASDSIKRSGRVATILALVVAFLSMSFIGLAEARPCKRELGHPNKGKNFILDLSSASDSIRLWNGLFGKVDSAVINVGGTNRTVNPGDIVTPAEFVAVKQVLLSQSQTINLDANGRATGGHFDLVSVMKPGHLASLVVPANVVALVETNKPKINITHVLSSDGTILGLPVDGGKKPLSFHAAYIEVGIGGAITTQVPSALEGLVGQITTPLNLELYADCCITNAGTIASSGTLLLSSKDQIINQLPTGAPSGTPLPLITSIAGTTLDSHTGLIRNAGIISSTQGAVTFLTVPGRDLLLNNLGGQILAQLGAINFRLPNQSASSLTQVTGGTLAGLTINFNGGNGPVIADVDQITGIVNGQVGTAAITVQTGTLDVGSITASTGGISLVSGQNVAINSADDPNQLLLTDSLGNISVTALNGDITIGDFAELRADGGNIILLASDDIAGGSGDIFSATGVRTNTGIVGGGIHLAAGVTSSTELQTLEDNRPAGFTSIPNPLPEIGASVTNNGSGLIKVNIADGGTIALNNNGNLSTININGGVVLLEAVGTESSLTMDGATMNVFMPVMSTKQAAGDQVENIVDTGDIDSNGSDNEDTVAASNAMKAI